MAAGPMSSSSRSTMRTVGEAEPVKPPEESPPVMAMLFVGE